MCLWKAQHPRLSEKLPIKCAQVEVEFDKKEIPPKKKSLMTHSRVRSGSGIRLLSRDFAQADSPPFSNCVASGKYVPYISEPQLPQL